VDLGMPRSRLRRDLGNSKSSPRGELHGEARRCPGGLGYASLAAPPRSRQQQVLPSRGEPHGAGDRRARRASTPDPGDLGMPRSQLRSATMASAVPRSLTPLAGRPGYRSLAVRRVMHSAWRFVLRASRQRAH
jgi:hypothetical protein